MTNDEKAALLDILQNCAYSTADAETFYNALDAAFPSVGNTDGLSTAVKNALLDIFQRSAYSTANGQDYYDVLETVFFPPPDVESISAVFTQGGAVIYETDSLDVLRQYLVVTATYIDTTTAVVTGYTLSGDLIAGTSTITVSYGGKTTTFTVIVTESAGDTTAQIAVEDKIITHHTAEPYYRETDKTNGCITIVYPLYGSTISINPAGVIPTSGNVIESSGANLVFLDQSQTIIGFRNEYDRWAQNQSGTLVEWSFDEPQDLGTIGYVSNIQFSLDKRYLDRAYMYDKVTGQVWFAGENTPYYGMKNAYGKSVAAISATFTQGTTAIYENDPIDKLRPLLSVAVTYSDNTSETIDTYTLSGTFTAGTSAITVGYGGRTQSISVTVTAITLPTGYTKVEYVASTGTSAYGGPFVSTGVTPSGTGDLIVQLGYLRTNSSTDNAYFISSTQNGTTSSIGFAVGISNSGKDATAFNGISGTITAYNGTKLQNLRLDVIAKFNTTSAEITNFRMSASDTGTGRAYSQYAIYLFGIKYSNSARLGFPAQGRIYYARVIENGSLILNLVPCVRDNDSAAGFYDLVNSNFITASAFTAPA